MKLRAIEYQRIKLVSALEHVIIFFQEVSHS